MTFSLAVKERTERGKKLAKMREAGFLPGVVYGPKEKPMPISIDKVTFTKLLKQTGESSVIVLDGLSKKKEVLVHDVSYDARRGGVVHVDFYAIETGKEISVDVPLEFVGEAPAIKLGGTLTKVLHEVEITCMPVNLPQHLTVDVSTLVDYDARICVKDLELPKGVKIENNPEDTIALVQPVEEEVIEEAVVDMSAIEVEKKGKADKPEGEASESTK